MRAEFVNWDDQAHVYENARVTAPDAFLRSWKDGREPGFYPVLYGIYTAEWDLGRHAPWLFHVDNVLLHSANAVLVGVLAGQVGMRPVAAWLAAALWALHPVHVESVAWVSERKNLLYVLFWFGSLFFFLRAERADAIRSWLLYAGSLAVYVLSLLSKGAAMTLPAGIVLVEWMRGGRLDRRLWLRLAPYVALGIAGGFGLVGLVPAHMDVPPFATRVAVAARAWWHYLAVFFWPHPLVPVYPRWPITSLGAADLVAVLAAVAVVALAVARRSRLPRVVLFGAAFFATNIVLVLGLVWNSYARFAFVADRYLYLPGVGLAIAAVAIAYAVAGALTLPPRAATIVLATWVAALGVVTVAQTGVWRDSEMLWSWTLAHHPDCAVCHLNLGNFLAERDDLDTAVVHYERALAIEPDQKTLLAFGKARARQARLDDAIALYGRALHVVPDDAETHYALANALRRQGKTEEAIASYRRALELDPSSADMHNNLGVALLDAEHVDEARAEFTRALELHPGDVDALLNLALIAENAEDWPVALSNYRAALSRAGNDPQYADAHRRFAAVLAREEHHDQAIAEYRIARRLLPDDDDVIDQLVSTLIAAGRSGEAVHELSGALEHHPDSVRLASSLAWLRATSADGDSRDGAQAVRLAEQVSALEPDDADALDTLAAAYAEAGRFDDAVKAARRALEVVGEDSDLADAIRSRIALYTAGHPFHLPAHDGRTSIDTPEGRR
jgi:tetratricopeptide (TPR) repeat protein